MTAWRRAIELSIEGEDLGRLMSIARSRTEAASRVCRAASKAGLLHSRCNLWGKGEANLLKCSRSIKFAAFDEFCKRLIGMGADHAPPPSHRGQSLGFLKAAIGPSPDRQASLPPWPPVIADAQATGAKSLRQITAALNGRSIAAARAGEWAADGGEPLRRIG